ncbi:hypothetical protein PoB_006889300 [Plakobranchus ocellatus]|uniref:Uncharacterized protein n=1 Tax=Plakobranchus ocellatus TaxID=259542 RepID=A0AAV4DDT7_9GAST|nr:hypothetical protein PoB_006889300 [Plakobranchus ocellatus]
MWLQRSCVTMISPDGLSRDQKSWDKGRISSQSPTPKLERQKNKAIRLLKLCVFPRVAPSDTSLITVKLCLMPGVWCLVPGAVLFCRWLRTRLGTGTGSVAQLSRRGNSILYWHHHTVMGMPGSFIMSA